MNKPSPISKILTWTGRAVMARLVARQMKLMRDLPEVREKMLAQGSHPEEFESLAGMPNFVLEQYADCLAQVSMEAIVAAEAKRAKEAKEAKQAQSGAKRKAANSDASGTSDKPAKPDKLDVSMQMDPKRVNELMMRKKEVVDWFHHIPDKSKLSQEKLNRDGSMLLCRRGSSRFECGLFREAVIFYKRAVEVDGGNKDAWLGLADAFEATGDKAEATKARAMAQGLA